MSGELGACVSESADCRDVGYEYGVGIQQEDEAHWVALSLNPVPLLLRPVSDHPNSVGVHMR